ncbi:MAG: hypothetical protein HY600_01825 [Candidatus Omnitrophica bacterium]|nr:hypothetical protein [Candidatus Omnitrophota bacterium]
MRSSAQQRYQAWRDLWAFSTRLALAGLRRQGHSPSQAWDIWRRRWARASQEHQQSNRRIVRWLDARTRHLTPRAG